MNPSLTGPTTNLDPEHATSSEKGALAECTRALTGLCGTGMEVAVLAWVGVDCGGGSGDVDQGSAVTKFRWEDCRPLTERLPTWRGD